MIIANTNQFYFKSLMVQIFNMQQHVSFNSLFILLDNQIKIICGS